MQLDADASKKLKKLVSQIIMRFAAALSDPNAEQIPHLIQ